MTALPVVIRPARPADVPLILSSWLRSYHDAPGVENIPNDVYFADTGHHGIVTRLLATAQTFVACAEDDSDNIQGWACDGGQSLLHYVYVKAPFRRIGIAKLLLGGYGGRDVAGMEGRGAVRCTHWTRAMRAWRAKGLPYVYDPYALRGALA